MKDRRDDYPDFFYHKSRVTTSKAYETDVEHDCTVCEWYHNDEEEGFSGCYKPETDMACPS